MPLEASRGTWGREAISIGGMGEVTSAKCFSGPSRSLNKRRTTLVQTNNHLITFK